MLKYPCVPKTNNTYSECIISMYIESDLLYFEDCFYYINKEY